MWRHEDVFFGAMGGAGGGGTPITHARGDRRALPRAAHAVRARLPVHARHRALDGVQRAVHRRHASSSRPSTTSTPLALWQLVEREQANFIVIVGDAIARPLLDALDTAEGRALDVSCLRVLLSGGAILSPALKRALVERLPDVLVVDGYGASETGGQGQSVVVVGRRRPDRAAVPRRRRHAGARRRPAARAGRASSAGSRAAGHIPLGYYKDPEKTAATFPSSTACAGRCPATTRSSRTTARSRCSAAARCRSTPAARRSTPKRSSRC